MANYECLFEDIGSVNKYDNLRHIPNSVLLDIGKTCCRLAVTEKSQSEHLCILDAGAGTGRFAMPCAHAASNTDINTKILAVDLSAKMLAEFKNNWKKNNLSVGLQCIQADIQEPLPIQAGSIIVVYTVATFHILDRWRNALDNLIDVLGPGGYLVFICENNQFMHQTEGFEKDSDFTTIDPVLKSFMEYYHQLRQKHGESYVPSEIRYSDMSSAITYLRESELKQVNVGITSDCLNWDKTHTYRDILHCFRHRQMTTWGSDLSENARAAIADDLEAWVEKRGINPSKEFLLPACLIPHVFQKTGEI